MLSDREETEDTYQVNLVLGEQRLGFLSIDAGVDDDILALLPVYRSSDAMLVTGLESIEHTDDLILYDIR
jgi:hypothetical protein